MTQSNNTDVFIVGVTGLTGSGTSTVAKILAKQNKGYVISADSLAHQVMKKGQGAYGQIVDIFGTGILDPHGEIDRKALGAIVFGKQPTPPANNVQSLATLEAIVHPAVIAQTHMLIQEANAQGYTFIVIDAPLLIESGMNKICKMVLLVTAPNQQRLNRIVARDAITLGAATARLNSRPGDQALLPYATAVISNCGGLQQLEEAVRCALAEYSR